MKKTYQKPVTAVVNVVVRANILEGSNKMVWGDKPIGDSNSILSRSTNKLWDDEDDDDWDF